MVLEALPKVAAEVAAPLSQAKKITMVADASGEVGASRSVEIGLFADLPNISDRKKDTLWSA